MEEAERLRKQRDENNMRMAWQTQQDRAAGKGKEREAAVVAPEQAPTHADGAADADGLVDPSLALQNHEREGEGDVPTALTGGKHDSGELFDDLPRWTG